MGEKIMDDKTIAPVHPGTVGATIGAQLREFLERPSFLDNSRNGNVIGICF